LKFYQASGILPAWVFGIVQTVEQEVKKAGEGNGVLQFLPLTYDLLKIVSTHSIEHGSPRDQ